MAIKGPVRTIPSESKGYGLSKNKNGESLLGGSPFLFEGLTFGNYFFMALRRYPRIPIRPEPNNQTAAGTGTGLLTVS